MNLCRYNFWRDFRIPVSLAMFATLVNDLWLKHSSLAGMLTGKLSDFCGLFFTPFVIMDGITLFRRVAGKEDYSRRTGSLVAGGSCLLIGALFILLKCCPGFARVYVTAYARLLGLKAVVVPDLSDLYALVAIGASYWYYSFIQRQAERRNA